MKIVRLLLAFVLFAQPCLAAPTGKLLKVENEVGAIAGLPSFAVSRFDRILAGMLDILGVNYVPIDSRDMKAQWGKTGIVGWGWGKTVADSCTRCETFDAVLWTRPNIGGPQINGSARMDSLLNSRRVADGGGGGNGLAVPNLFLFDDYRTQQGSQTMQATCCTTGINNIGVSDQYVYGLQRPVGSLQGWFTAGLFQRTMTRKTGTTAAGGYRPMLVANQPASFVTYAGAVTNCAFCDSIPGADAATGEDSVIVFSLPYSNISGSKPLIVAYADGVGQPGGDSLSNLDGEVVSAEVDPTVILYALAALDSAAGNTLFDYDKLPIKIGLVIEAANVYGGNRAGPGIPPQDSLNLAATIDSMAAHEALGGVKYRPTVAINVAGLSGAGDSLDATGAYSSAWLDRWRKVGAKFTPQSWAGILSEYRRATAGVGDIWGFNRSRAFVGDFDQTTGTADTSVAQQLKWAKRLLIQAGVDPNEMSKTAVAPLWDWAPANRNTASDMDSALYAARLAGFTTIVSDANLPQSNPYRQGGVSMASATYRGVSNGLMGYTSNQGRYKDAGGGYVNVLASNGHDITGGTMQYVVNDSSAFTTYYGNLHLYGIFRAVGGLLTPGDNQNSDYLLCGSDFDGVADGVYYSGFKDKLIAHTLLSPVPGEVSRFRNEKANILRLTTADLSGCTGCPRGAPARNGWWIIKSLKNWMDAVNKAAGKTVIQFDYPENIAP